MRMLAALALSAVAACAPEKMDGSAEARQPSRTQTGAPSVAAAARVPTVLFFGTSLTAGYGLTADRAYPAVVERLANKDGVRIRAINAGLSGETSAGALRRIDWVLRNPADIVVIETGANDGLRALDVDATRANIAQIVRRVQRAHPRARILLVQMEAPPNFGLDYTLRFRSMYSTIAGETDATLVPFLLEGVAAVPELNQADGLHPNVAGAERVAENVWRMLKPVVESVSNQSSRAGFGPAHIGRAVVKESSVGYT